MGRFEDRVAIVTGAGSGTGAAIAVRLAEEGASVVCTDVNGAERRTAERQGSAAAPSPSTWATPSRSPAC